MRASFDLLEATEIRALAASQFFQWVWVRQECEKRVFKGGPVCIQGSFQQGF